MQWQAKAVMLFFISVYLGIKDSRLLMYESSCPVQSRTVAIGTVATRVTMGLLLQNYPRILYDKVQISSINDSMECRRGQSVNMFKGLLFLCVA